MPIPLHGFLQGDTLGLLILAEGNDTVDSLAKKLQRAASVRVPTRPGARVKVIFRDRVLEPSLSVSAAGIEALDRFDVVFDEA